MDFSCLDQDGEDVLIDLKVVPNSSRFEIKEINPWRGELKITVSSQAKKGKANEELIQELRQLLGKEIIIVSGKTSRNKKLRIKNISTEEVSEKLGLKNNGK